MQAGGDPTIVKAPWGPEVDGRRLLGEAVGFGRALRAARPRGRPRRRGRLRPGPDARRHRRPRAGPGAGAAIFIRRRDDREIYDTVFDRWWRRRASRLPGSFEPPSMPDPHAPADGRGARRRAARGGRDRGEPGAGRTRDPDPVRRRRRWRGVADRGRRHRPRCLQPGRGAAPSRVRPDDPGRAARGGAAGRRPGAPPRAATDPSLRAALPRAPPRAAGDVPAQPRDRRPARRVGLAAADPRAALARRDLRHLGVDGAPLAPAAALRPGALGGVRGPDRVVRVRDAPDPRHAAAA